MAKEKNLTKLAKGNKVSTSVVETKKPISPAEQRDLKAKAAVEELLHDVPLTLEKKETISEVEENKEQKQGIEWLEEQVQLLSESNENLKAELILAKDDYSRIFEENQRLKNGGGDEAIKLKVIELFNELQNNHLQLGSDPITNIGNFRIYCPGFLNRLIIFFPFLESVRKF